MPPSTQNLGYGFATQFGNLLRRLKHFQPFQRCLCTVCRVVGTIALCTNVFDAGQLQYCTDRTARNNAGTFRSRKQQYQPFAKFPFDLVRNAGTYDRYANEVALCILGAFADRFRDLSCFAAANADQTVFVADDDQSGKAEVTSALYYFGYAVYGNKFFFQL